MTFTSQIQPIGGERGTTPATRMDTDPLYVSPVGDLPAGSIGREGSGDDPQELFPDTFVDMAQDAELAAKRPSPKMLKKGASLTEEEVSEEDLGELPDEEVL